MAKGDTGKIPVHILDKLLNKIESEWRFDVWAFLEDAIGVLPAEPVEELKEFEFDVQDQYGDKTKLRIFDDKGLPCYTDMKFYRPEYFKDSSKADFKAMSKELAKQGLMRLTWQQTLEMTMYQRAILTFKEDSNAPDIWRYITIVSGHGCGKTSFLAIAMIHFLICFFGAQITVTANTENQLKDVFIKEFTKWKMKLPEALRDNLRVLDTMIRVGTDQESKDKEKDWFLRTRVARKENLEALAGLHGEYVAVVVDEASGVIPQVFEVLSGALTGKKYIVIYTSNGTRSIGDFYNSHKQGAHYSQLRLNSEESPIVEDNYIDRMAKQYGRDSEEYAVRVLGKFPDTAQMDEKGWIPLSANLNITFMPENNQVMTNCVFGLDVAGDGKDRTIMIARDITFMRTVINEKTSTPRAGVAKATFVVKIYNGSMADLGIDGFGEGAKWLPLFETKRGDEVVALLTDKPKIPEGVDPDDYIFKNYNAELIWRFREWVAKGGVIITNNPKQWRREFDNMKYRRTSNGKIEVMSTREYKKEYGHSPDLLKAGSYSFHRDKPVQKAYISQEDKDWLQIQKETEAMESYTQGDSIDRYSGV